VRSVNSDAPIFFAGCHRGQESLLLLIGARIDDRQGGAVMDVMSVANPASAAANSSMARQYSTNVAPEPPY
jgi:hypothetical protein